jgi:TonB family protein
MLINASSTYAYERRVFIRSVMLAVILHIGVLGFLVAGHLLFSVKPVQPAIMSVGLASATSLKGPGGKKTKAPVMRKRKAPPKKKVVQHKKKTTRKKKPRKNEVGLNKKKKTHKKNRPAQAKEDTNPVVENPGKRTQTGGTGGMADSGISFEVGGGQEGTAVQDLPYLAYLQTIQMELAQRWARSGLSGGVTTVTFRINRDGSIQDAEVSESSGKRYLDGPALRAVLGARLPPLPQGCMDDYLILHYQFHY